MTNLFHNPLIALLTKGDGCTIPQAADALGLSIGTVTKHMVALTGAGYAEDCGPIESSSGRRPHLYRLRPGAGWFLGVDVNDRYVNVGLMDFAGEMNQKRLVESYALDDPGALDRLIRILQKAAGMANKGGHPLTAIGLSIPGRVNPETGQSFSFFHQPGAPLADRLREKLGLPAYIYNDTRAMTYGELLKGAGAGCRNMLLINVNWGLGMGIVIDGAVYGGKSGFAGEFGHVYGYDNQIICRCGKRGCNETEISGQALRRNLERRIREGESSILSPRVLSSDKPLTLSEIMEAVEREDVLCIDAIEKIGVRLGEKVSGLINVFNPEVVVVGGELAMTGDYLLDPMRMAVNKHAIHLVSEDTRIVRSMLRMDAGIVGACLVARSRHIGERFEC